MSDFAVRLANLGKRYRLYRSPSDKVFDALGLGGVLGVKRRTQDFWALRGANLEIKKGERVGIIGRNGAGKSTLLKILCGKTSPSEGEFEVKGTIQALLELGTGFHPEFTGKENIRSALAYQGLTASQIRDKIEEIIDFAELEEFIHQPVRTYSAGMYARLAFATSTAVEPDLLIIDEILGAGDAYFAGKCVERMRTLTEGAGATVLFVSHDLGSVQRLCPRAIWIERGQVRRDGESLQVIKEYSAVVRQEEELRLRARDMKLRKKQAGAMEAGEDLYHELLFHLVPANGAALKSETRIYGIRLCRGTEEVAAIAVGEAMDNSPEYSNHLLTDKEFMDGGETGTDARGRYRPYGDFGGKYGHAPFKLAVPRTYEVGGAGEAWSLEVAYAGGEAVAVEVFGGATYHRLGVLAPGEKQMQIRFSGPLLAEGMEGKSPAVEAVVPPAGEAPTEKQIHEYGSQEARITAVRMYNSQGSEARVFDMGRPVRVELDYAADLELVNPVFVFCVYLPDGQCAAQWGFATRERGVERIRGKGRVVFQLPRLHLGRGSYVASAAIFKRLRSDSLEAESYHVLDRCIHFQVLQPAPPEGDPMPRGLCLQPFESELIHE